MSEVLDTSVPVMMKMVPMTMATSEILGIAVICMIITLKFEGRGGMIMLS